MKKILSALLIVVLLYSLIQSVPIRAAYEHSQTITITDTGGVPRTNVPVIVTGIIGSSLVTLGYINSDGTNTAMVDADGDPVSYMLSTTQTQLVIPVLPALSSVVLTFYMGYDPAKTVFPIILGSGGYITTTDTPALEMGNNFQVEFSGNIDTSVANKNVVFKDSAYRIWVSSVGNISAGISSTDDVSQLLVNATQTPSGASWKSQTFTTPAYNVLLTSFDLTWTQNGAASNITASIRAVDGANKPTGSDIVAATVVESTGVLNFNVTDTVLTASTRYAIVIRVDGDGADLNIQNSDVYANGQYFSSADSGATWGAAEARDAYFKAYLNGYAGGLVFNALASGDHIIKTTADGANHKLYIDGTLVDTTALGGASVPNNANNYIWLANNIVCEADYIRLTVGGVEVVEYQPAVMLTGTTLVDLDAGDQNGAITWGANVDLTVVVSGYSSAPNVITFSPSAITNNSATMQGEVTGMGTYTSASVYFQYGLDTSYGGTTSPQVLSAAGVYYVIQGNLNYNTIYHCRAVAVFSGGTFYGDDVSFTTTPYAGSSTTVQMKSQGVFSDFWETGDLIFCAELANTYTAYYPDKIAGQWFTLQLIGTDHATLIAASPISAWGDRPSSIYLSAAKAATITKQGTYYLKMIGNGALSGYSVEYHLTSGDWLGSTQSRMADWCRGIAKSMQVSDNTTYLQSATDVGEIINDSGGAYFTLGIPGIAQVLPNLFATAKEQAQFVAGTANNTFDVVKVNYAVGTADFVNGSAIVEGHGTTWAAGMIGGLIQNTTDGAWYEITNVLDADTLIVGQNYSYTGGLLAAYSIEYYTSNSWTNKVGATLTNDANTFGNLFGITGDIGIAIILVVLVIVIVIGAIMSGGGAGVGIFGLCMPVLMFGNYIKVIGVQWTIVIGIFFVFLFVRQFIWKTL